VVATIAAEQFGTNIRATVATTVPNFVRGATVPLTLAFNYLKLKPACGIVNAAAIISFACVLIALWALRGLEETYDKELDYLEPV
jgi:MFS transporter, putative metabolite:H+ symporter